MNGKEKKKAENKYWPSVFTGGGDLGWDIGGVAYISGLATFGADFGRASDVPEMHKDSENLISYAILRLILAILTILIWQCPLTNLLKKFLFSWKDPWSSGALRSTSVLGCTLKKTLRSKKLMHLIIILYSNSNHRHWSKPFLYLRAVGLWRGLWGFFCSLRDGSLCLGAALGFGWRWAWAWRWTCTWRRAPSLAWWLSLWLLLTFSHLFLLLLLGQCHCLHGHLLSL